MLTNFEIKRICKKLELPIVGVYSKNELYNLPRKVGSYYINLMDDDKVDGEGNNGSHWVLAKIYCDDDRDNVDTDSEQEHKICNALYFDSFGFGMPKAVSEFLKPFRPVYCNNREIQSINTTECGWYCIYCDYTLEHKQYGETYIDDYEMFLEKWDSNPKENLKLLRSFMDRVKRLKS
jgi:hypothetical protein